MDTLEVRSAERGSGADQVLPVTVVVCAYTEERWTQTCAALQSALTQKPRPAQVLLVVDHNPYLEFRAQRELSQVTVVHNAESKGLSGARNTGLAHATQPVTVFLDDDAEARPGWLAALVEPYSRPEVVATGGSVHPRWPGERPWWFPGTFDWVIGCSYVGMPTDDGVIRNPIGANMSLRTESAVAAGGFDAGIGRVGHRPRGCEETELCIRLTERRSGSSVWYVPIAAVDHHVSRDRLTGRYFLHRCWHEGRSKADVVRMTNSSAGLASERRHAVRIIPVTILRDVRVSLRGDTAGLGRAAAATCGLAATTAGYLAGRLSQAVGARKRQRTFRTTSGS